MAISEADQIQFLTNIQRILSEGVFTSTYKFALLLAFADICVEHGKDSDDTLCIRLEEIADKFVTYYWRQSRPYLGAGNGTESLLSQNNGQTPVVIKLLNDLDERPSARPNSLTERRLLREVQRTIRKMPLVYLQNIGSTRLEFLYDQAAVGETVVLKAGVMACFRKFYPMVTDLIRGAWIRYIRRKNSDVLGLSNDLDEFLFGTERASLAGVVPILRDLQNAECFYCRNPIQGSPHVDHFIPWTRYPLDLGHNFVLAHNACNLAKSDMLAAEVHLENWVERNTRLRPVLESGFRDQGILFDLGASNRIALWAYEQAKQAASLSWLEKKELRPISDRWRDLFATSLN